MGVRGIYLFPLAGAKQENICSHRWDAQPSHWEEGKVYGNSAPPPAPGVSAKLPGLASDVWAGDVRVLTIRFFQTSI